jgi:hypothetical protein
MIRVGLLGEDPNDTSSVKNLLEKKYKNKVVFVPILKRIKGFQLDNPKVQNALPIEFNSKKCHFAILIRDLDGFASQANKVKIRSDWFSELNGLIKNKGIFLLNIWELEALIFADIENFNINFKLKYKFTGNPSFIRLLA